MWNVYPNNHFLSKTTNKLKYIKKNLNKNNLPNLPDFDYITTSANNLKPFSFLQFVYCSLILVVLLSGVHLDFVYNIVWSTMIVTLYLQTHKKKYRTQIHHIIHYLYSSIKQGTLLRYYTH